MCTNETRELKRNRSYGEVIYLMRIANVQKESIGYELLLTAIVSYLKDSSLELADLLKIASRNSPMMLGHKEECFELMKEALQNVYTKHEEKLYDDNVVWKFIQNIAFEVRMREIIELMINKENLLRVNENIKVLFCKVAIRTIMKPEDSFDEVLTRICLKEGYQEPEDLAIDLYAVVRNNNIKKEIEDELAYLNSNPNKKAEKKKELVQPIKQELEALVKECIEKQKDIIFSSFK